jgi:hypothetical protein
LQKQTAELQTQTAALQMQTTNLEEVRQSLSTRYLGHFPQYYPGIVELLKRAKREIIIFCDFPAYGSFTDQNSWIDYKQTLERKIHQEEVRVSLTCLDAERRTKSVREQFFATNQDWNDWKIDTGNREQLKAFLKTHCFKQDLEHLDKEEFFTMVEKDEIRALEETFATADVRKLDTYVPLFFWLIDGISAIFSIPSTSEIEYGFSTTDQKLISAFTDMRRRYRDVTIVSSTKSPSEDTKA